LVTNVNYAKTNEPIEKPFKIWTWVGRRNHVLGVGLESLDRFVGRGGLWVILGRV